MAEIYERNIFTQILEGELPCHKVYEDQNALAFMDIMPRADGHVLVIPKVHARNILDIEPLDLSVFMMSVQKVAKSVKTAFNADGITIQQFNESAGGQVVFHLHFHIIPRFAGDSLRPHTGEMEDPDKLASLAEKIAESI